MEALQARALLFQRKLKEIPVNIALPDLPELDGQLSVLELGADQLRLANQLAETPDGTTDHIRAMAAAICLSLVMRETKERVFSDNDVEGVAKFGYTVLNPLNDLVELASGLSKNAVEIAKKNSLATQENGSNSTSPTASEATPSKS